VSLLRGAVLALALLAPLAAADPAPAPAPHQRPLLGLTLGDPEPLGGTPGLLVQRLSPGGAAESMGVKVGDRVLSANGHDLAAVADLGKAIEALGGRGQLRLALLRDGQRIEVSTELAPPPTPQELAQLEAQVQARLERIASMPRDERSQVQRLLTALAQLERGLAPAREDFARAYPDGELSLKVSIDIRSDAGAADAKEIAAPAPAAEPPRASQPAP
jgi:hypothetical protein